jgi:hypothetical protein
MSSTMYRLWMSAMHAGGMHFDAFWHVLTPPIHSPVSLLMTSPVSPVADTPAVLDGVGPERIDPATSFRIESTT